MTTAMTEAPKPKPTKAELIVRAKNDLGNKNLSLNHRVGSVETILRESSDQILQTLPKHISADRMIRLFLREIRKCPKLLDCTPESLFGSMSEAASLGLETDGILGHAYLIPYGKEVQLVPGYKGLLDLARRKDRVLIKTRCVFPEDFFDYAEGDEDFIKHKPSEKAGIDQSPARITHVYLVAKDESGLVICRAVWARNKLESHKERYSQGWKWAENGDKSRGGGKKDSPWHTNWSEMARKTVIREAIARGELPVSAEIQRLAARDEILEQQLTRSMSSLGSMPALPAPRIAGRSDSDRLADRLDGGEHFPPVLTFSELQERIYAAVADDIEPLGKLVAESDLADEERSALEDLLKAAETQANAE